MFTYYLVFYVTTTLSRPYKMAELHSDVEALYIYIYILLLFFYYYYYYYYFIFCMFLII